MKKLLFILLALLPLQAFAGSGDNFRPCQTVKLSCTSSSSRVALSACGAPTLNVECYNSGSVPVYMAGGGSTIAATAPTGTAALNNYPLGSGLDKVFDLGSSTYIACITDSTSATLYCTSGAGQ